MIRGTDLSHADICEISTELEGKPRPATPPPRSITTRCSRLRRQLSEAHRHPSPTVLSHQRDWPGRDVGAEQCRGTGTARLRTCAALLQSLGRPGCSGRRNCNVNLDDLRGDRPDLHCEPQQARATLAIFNRTRQLWWLLLVPSQTDLNQAEGGRECHFERFMQAAWHTYSSPFRGRRSE
jgi:hypothetical protein